MPSWAGPEWEVDPGCWGPVVGCALCLQLHLLLVLGESWSPAPRHPPTTALLLGLQRVLTWLSPLLGWSSPSTDPPWAPASCTPASTGTFGGCG